MKLTPMIIAAGVLAAPASAAVTTIEYTMSTGESAVWTYDDATMTATADGVDVGAYTWDEATSTVCATLPEQGDVCATFETPGADVGHSTPFTSSVGVGGTATITAVE